MSSIDSDRGFPDYPLSFPGIAIFVAGGILLVGLALVVCINMLFPLRPPTLALRFLLPTWLVETGSRLELAPGGIWHRQHTIAITLIVAFFVVGPITLARSIREIMRADPERQTIGAAWLTGAGLAVGSGLTFFAMVGPLIALPKTLIDDYRTRMNADRLFERTVLAADMELMAVRAQALYFGSADTLTAWAGGPARPPISLADINAHEPTLQLLLSGAMRVQRSLFVLTVTHADTLLIYGMRGAAGTTFDRTAVLEACNSGDPPPGISITPASWKWTFG